jgi:hypothetical protein
MLVHYTGANRDTRLPGVDGCYTFYRFVHQQTRKDTRCS